jgi:uncharacterized protein YjiS (DUF1127 family)
MAHIESIAYAEHQSVESSVVSRLKAAWNRYLQARQDRHLIAKLSRLDQHLVEDMGLDPERIYAAVDGTWDEVRRSEFPRV